LRSIIDTKKIFLVNISRGSLGTDGANLLASLLLTSLASAGFSRIDMEEKNRVPYIIFLDEFQNYTTGSMAGAISELRKFAIGFVFAHQYLGQLQPAIKNAVLGNVGTIVCFKLGTDAKQMEQEFYPIFKASDFINLEHFHVYIKLLINGKVSAGFSAKTIQIQDLQK
jgi:hypothetical protein